jgi:hypothetical protein
MKILNDLISSIDMKAEVREIRIGLFHTAVLTRNGGLAATLTRYALKQHHEGESIHFSYGVDTVCGTSKK